MIKYNLKCTNNHEFESWFSDSNEFENLKKKNLLECIFCSSKKIDKSIMSPMLSGTKEKNNHMKLLNEKLQNEKNKLLQLRKFVENNFEYVGKNLAKKLEKYIMTKKTKKLFMDQLLWRKEKN
jgi:hypothetical protein